MLLPVEFDALVLEKFLAVNRVRRYFRAEIEVHPVREFVFAIDVLDEVRIFVEIAAVFPVVAVEEVALLRGAGKIEQVVDDDILDDFELEREAEDDAHRRRRAFGILVQHRLQERPHLVLIVEFN